MLGNWQGRRELSKEWLQVVRNVVYTGVNISVFQEGNQRLARAVQDPNDIGERRRLLQIPRQELQASQEAERIVVTSYNLLLSLYK